jgi:hypothetical protein
LAVTPTSSGRHQATREQPDAHDDATWNDANRNYVPDCDLRNPVSNGECGPWSNLTFGQLVGSRYADGVLSGWNREYANWQGSVALQHELRPGFGVSVGYFRTWYVGDAGGSGIPNAETTLTVTDNLKVTPSDFDQYCITAPTDSRCPTAASSCAGCSMSGHRSSGRRTT